jgi:hypothetical protein
MLRRTSAPESTRIAGCAGPFASGFAAAPVPPQALPSLSALLRPTSDRTRSRQLHDSGVQRERPGCAPVLSLDDSRAGTAVLAWPGQHLAPGWVSAWRRQAASCFPETTGPLLCPRDADTGKLLWSFPMSGVDPRGNRVTYSVGGKRFAVISSKILTRHSDCLEPLKSSRSLVSENSSSGGL